MELEFDVTVGTQWGDSVVICGDAPELGHWQPERGFEHVLRTAGAAGGSGGGGRGGGRSGGGGSGGEWAGRC